MEPVTLPANSPLNPGSKPAERNYKRFVVGFNGETITEKEAVIEEKINSAQKEAEQQETVKKYEFFYVGKSQKKVSLLVSIFDAGFIAESIEQAIEIFE